MRAGPCASASFAGCTRLDGLPCVGTCLRTLQGFEELLTHLKADVVTWSHARLRRVLTAALASPISQQDLADADAALEQGFTGSLSRGATFSGDAEREAAAAASSSGGEEAAGGGGGGGAAAAPPPGAAGQLQGGAAGAAGEDAVTADLAAAQQQIDDELMEMVSGLRPGRTFQSMLRLGYQCKCMLD